MAFAPDEDADQPGHPMDPWSELILPPTVRIKCALIFSYPTKTERRIWSYLVDTEAVLNRRWAHIPNNWLSRVAAYVYSNRSSYKELAQYYMFV